MKIPFLIGRLVFGGFFLYNGINHFKQRKAMSQHAASRRVPMPETAVTVSGAILTLGGASILLGVKPKLGAAAIIGFLAAHPDEHPCAVYLLAHTEAKRLIFVDVLDRREELLVVRRRGRTAAP